MPDRSVAIRTGLSDAEPTPLVYCQPEAGSHDDFDKAKHNRADRVSRDPT
jgi:hypothetical protein